MQRNREPKDSSSFYSQANTIRQKASKYHGVFRIACNFGKSLFIDALSNPSKPRVWDFACGSGGDLDKFRQSVGPGLMYWGCDNAPGAIAEAESRASKKSIPASFHVVDAANSTPPGDSADLAWCAFAGHYFFDSDAHLDALVSRMSRAETVALLIPNHVEILKRILSGRKSGKLWKLDAADETSAHLIRGRAWSLSPVLIRFEIGGFTPALEPLAVLGKLDAAMGRHGKSQISRMGLDAVVKGALQTGLHRDRLSKMMHRVGGGEIGDAEYDALALYQLVVYQ